jgi:hypothetical protein
MCSVLHRRIRTAALVLLLCASFQPFLAAMEETEKTDDEYKNAIKALKGGAYGVTLRYRYEHVSDDAFTKGADASTLRTTLWYKSAGFHQLRAYLQFEDVSNLGLADDHNDTQNGITDRPVIADPPATEIHQVTLGYSGLPDTNLEFGRREITLDDHRFVGNVAWRQNYQSFDTFFVTQESIPRTKLTYAYVNNVKTVVATNQGISSNLFNANIDLDRFGTAVAYYYYLDYDSVVRSPFSSRSIGAFWKGKVEVGKFDLPFHVELAQQTDVGSNPGRIDAGYRRAEFGAKRDRWSVKLGYELLEGSVDDGQFNTPLATLYKFNGWADKFLITPPNGLQDIYLVGTYDWSRYKAILAFHSFDADTGGASYGEEIDFRFVYTAPWKQQFALSFALFDGDDPFRDTNKIWVLTQYTF